MCGHTHSRRALFGCFLYKEEKEKKVSLYADVANEGIQHNSVFLAA